MQTEKAKAPSRKLNDIVGAPFLFTLKDGTKLGLDDWTLYSEQWAVKVFGSMQAFYSTIFETPTKDGATEEEMREAVDASILVAAHQLNDDSRRQVDERLGEEQTTEEFLAKHLRYSDFRELCTSIMNMIKSSFPEGWEELAKKKHQGQSVNPTTRKK
jgi:hypothetical protein